MYHHHRRCGIQQKRYIRCSIGWYQVNIGPCNCDFQISTPKSISICTAVNTPFFFFDFKSQEGAPPPDGHCSRRRNSSHSSKFSRRCTLDPFFFNHVPSKATLPRENSATSKYLAVVVWIQVLVFPAMSLAPEVWSTKDPS